MTTLVTGSSGFVCVNVVRALGGLDERVVAFDLTPPDDAARRFLAPVTENVSFVVGDVCDQALLDQTCREYSVDSIIHGATITASSRAVEMGNPARIASVNLGGTIALLEAAVRSKVGRFVYISSGSIYGLPGSISELVSEETPRQPVGLYGITKLAAEQTTLRWHELHGMDNVVVRLAVPFGPMERPTGARLAPSLVYAWVTAAMRDERPIVPHLDGFRDFTYIDDIVAGIVAAWGASSLRHRVFNLGGGRPYSAIDVREAIRRAFPTFDVEVSPERGEFPATFSRESRGAFDITRARTELGFSPRYDLTTGIARYVEWLRGQKGDFSSPLPCRRG